MPLSINPTCRPIPCDCCIAGSIPQIIKMNISGIVSDDTHGGFSPGCDSCRPIDHCGDLNGTYTFRLQPPTIDCNCVWSPADVVGGVLCEATNTDPPDCEGAQDDLWSNSFGGIIQLYCQDVDGVRHIFLLFQQAFDDCQNFDGVARSGLDLGPGPINCKEVFNGLVLNNDPYLGCVCYCDDAVISFSC